MKSDFYYVKNNDTGDEAIYKLDDNVFYFIESIGKASLPWKEQVRLSECTRWITNGDVETKHLTPLERAIYEK